MKIRNLYEQKYSLSILSISLILIVNLLVFLKIPGAFYLYLFILGIILSYYILKETDFFKLWVMLLTSFFWSSALLILLSGLLAIVSIPIRTWILYIPSLLLFFLLVKKPISTKGLEWRPGIDGIVLLFFTGLSIWAHVSSVKDFVAPILHDPISHATWAKQIYDTGMINYFYSPGLHILAALGKIAEGAYVSQYILVITNLFNALMFIPAYLFVRTYFKSKDMALLTAVFFLVAKYPAAYFWTMGKNALVLGIGFMFLLLFVSTLDLTNLKKLLVTNFLVLVLVLIHYPTAFIALIGLFFLLVFDKGGWKNLRHIALGCGLGVLWGFMKMGYQVANMEERVVNPRALEFSLKNLLSFSEGIYDQVIGGTIFNFPLGSYLAILGLLGLSIMLIISLKGKQYLCFILILLANLVVAFFIKFTERLGFLDIIYKTQILISFVFIYIGAAFLMSEVVGRFIKNEIKISKLPAMVAILFLVSFGNYQIYTKYKESQTSLSMVQEEDIQGYKFLEGLECEGVILNNGQVGDRKNIVYASDAGAWIPVFTDLEIAMPFTEFASKNTHENYDIYLNIRNGEYTCSDIDGLLEKEIKYYYKGSRGIFGPQLSPNKENQNFELIYSEGGVEIFRIIPCTKVVLD